MPNMHAQPRPPRQNHTHYMHMLFNTKLYHQGQAIKQSWYTPPACTYAFTTAHTACAAHTQTHTHNRHTHNHDFQLQYMTTKPRPYIPTIAQKVSIFVST